MHLVPLLLTLALQSGAPGSGQPFPKQYTCDGGGHMPTISVGNVPLGAESLALVMTDLDAPKDRQIHWIVWGVPYTSLTIGPVLSAAGRLASPTPLSWWQQGWNSFGQASYTAPCPKAGANHRYLFSVFALDRRIVLRHIRSFLHRAGWNDAGRLTYAMTGHILDFGTLVVTLKR